MQRNVSFILDNILVSLIIISCKMFIDNKCLRRFDLLTRRSISWHLENYVNRIVFFLLSCMIPVLHHPHFLNPDSWILVSRHRPISISNLCSLHLLNRLSLPSIPDDDGLLHLVGGGGPVVPEHLHPELGPVCIPRP